MGTIAADVKNVYLVDYPEHEEFLKLFLNGFDVSYAEKKCVNNTVLYVFLLKPEQYIKDGFGIDKEIMLAYTPYDTIQPRTIQALNMMFDVFPFKNRVDTLNCFLLSKDSEVVQYTGVANFSEGQSRVIVPFVYDDLIQNGNDSWYIRNHLRKTAMMLTCLAIRCPCGTRLLSLVASKLLPGILMPLDGVKTVVFLVSEKPEKHLCSLK